MNTSYQFSCIKRVTLAAVLACCLLPGLASAQLTVLEGGFVVTTLPPGVGSKGAECSPGGIWGNYIYFSDSSADRVDRVDFGDNMFLFASGAPEIVFPVGLAFGPGPASTFGNFLYVASFESDLIARVDPTGVPSAFATLTGAGDVTFDPSGAYGNDLFATTAFSGPISTIDPTGVVSLFSTLAATYIRFGPGGAWGTGMYSTSHGPIPGIGIATVASDGTATLLSGGFDTPEGFDWASGSGFGGDMFAADLNTNEIWRVKPDGTRTLFATVPGPAGIAFCNGALYVSSFEGGCWKIEAGPVPVESMSWGSIKQRHAAVN